MYVDPKGLHYLPDGFGGRRTAGFAREGGRFTGRFERARQAPALQAFARTVHTLDRDHSIVRAQHLLDSLFIPLQLVFTHRGIVFVQRFGKLVSTVATGYEIQCPALLRV